MKLPSLALLRLSLLSAALAFLCTSCDKRPHTYTSANGDQVADLGWSILKKSKSITASIKKADGTVIDYNSTDGDETKLLSVYGNLQLADKASPIIQGTGTVLKKIVQD